MARQVTSRGTEWVRQRISSAEAMRRPAGIERAIPLPATLAEGRFRLISVSTHPGATQLTVIPGAHSMQRFDQRDHRPFGGRIVGVHRLTPLAGRAADEQRPAHPAVA